MFVQSVKRIVHFNISCTTAIMCSINSVYCVAFRKSLKMTATVEHY